MFLGDLSQNLRKLLFLQMAVVTLSKILHGYFKSFCFAFSRKCALNGRQLNARFRFYCDTPTRASMYMIYAYIFTIQAPETRLGPIYMKTCIKMLCEIEVVLNLTTAETWVFKFYHISFICFLSCRAQWVASINSKMFTLAYHERPLKITYKT